MFGQNETTRSDFRIFNADGGDMISQMASSNDFFLNTCTNMFERMINTVPRDVKLTDVIKPLKIKPRKLSVTVNDDQTLSVSGFIRVSAILPPAAELRGLEWLTKSNLK